MTDPDIARGTAKQWWLRCVSCSEAAITTQNRCAGIEASAEEQAAGLLSGGLMHEGNACGLLVGAILSAGMQAHRRLDDDDTRSAAALEAARRLTDAYPETSGALNCREIIGQSVITLREKLRYGRSGKGRQCGRLSMKWAGRATAVIDDALTEAKQRGSTPNCANCAVKTSRRIASEMGLEPSDSVMVAGLAGGVGLAGNSCAALTVGIIALSLRHYRARESKPRDSKFRSYLHELGLARFRKTPAHLHRAFKRRFGSQLCSEISGRRFATVDEHGTFIAQGGCSEVIAFVADHVS